jgi:hypothetical protein
MAIIKLQQWEVNFGGGDRRLLYADERDDLSLLDIELRSTQSIRRTKVMGLGSDGECLYDGKRPLPSRDSCGIPQPVPGRRG